LRAPLSISLQNDAFGTRIDVTDLSLTDGSVELLANGSFDRGLDHWLVFSDVHLAWRALNTPVQVIFEQGLFGAIAWVAIGLSLLAAGVGRTDVVARAAAAGAMAGLIVVGCFDTLLDAPRLAVLVSLVLWLGWQRGLPAAPAAVRRTAPAPVRSNDQSLPATFSPPLAASPGRRAAPPAPAPASVR